MTAIQQSKYEDTITTLPTNNNPLSPQDMHTFNTFLNTDTDSLMNIFNNYREIFIGTILFIILSLPYSNDLIHKFCLPTQKSDMILLGVKTLIYIGIFFLILSVILK